MARARNILQLRLRHAATPARVARAAAMLDEALQALGPLDERTTLVVENLKMVTTVRTRTKADAETVETLIQIAKAPTAAPARPGRNEAARVLAQYAHDEGQYRPQLWRPGQRGGVICDLDEAFARVMEAIATAPPIGSHKAHGTTYVYTKILRVGRVNEQQGVRVRVAVEGRHHELSIGQLDAGPFYDAAKHGTSVRLKLQAEWTQTPGKSLSLTTAEIVGMEDAPLASGARILALAKQYNVITADELPVVLASIEKARSGE